MNPFTNINMSASSEVKTEAKMVDNWTRCPRECQTKDKCTEYEEKSGRCFWWMNGMSDHCGNPHVQIYCLRFAKK